VAETGTSSTQRAASLKHLPAVLAELGVELDAVLARAGVSARKLSPDAYIPYAAYLAILEHAAVLTGRDDIGLCVGKRQTLDSLGPLGRVMQHAATLGEALADFANFQISNSTGGAVYLHHLGTGFFLGYGTYDSIAHASPHIHDVVLAVGSNLVAELTERVVRPIEMWSVRPAPRDRAPYEQLLGCPIRFGERQTGLFLPAASIGHHLPAADRSARQTALAVLGPQLTRAPWGVAGQVRHALRSLLLIGRTRMPDMAQQLGLHPRTLRRALAGEGTTFEALKNEVRYAVARELLTLTVLPVGEISLTLDFASPSAFVHAFRRWSGTSPARWRETQSRTRCRPSR